MEAFLYLLHFKRYQTHIDNGSHQSNHCTFLMVIVGRGKEKGKVVHTVSQAKLFTDTTWLIERDLGEPTVRITAPSPPPAYRYVTSPKTHELVGCLPSRLA